MKKVIIPLVGAAVLATSLWLTLGQHTGAEATTDADYELVSKIRENNPRFANASIVVHRNLAEFGFANLYEINLGGQNMVVTENGRYAFVGDFFDLSDITNLSAEHRTERMAQVAEQELPNVTDEMRITFPVNDGVQEIGSIYVFTDPTCTYCRRLHQELDEYAAAGVTVHYLPYPRSGLQRGRDFTQLSAIYCADDRQTAMDDFKFDRAGDKYAGVGTTAECHEIIERGYRLGQRVGVTGTPFIVLSSGGVIPGYNPARQIIQRMQ